MTTNIPPQAYTRDTLVKAIEWISHQPQAVRERANSADLIVSFYLQARRRMTAAQLEAPVSGENFKQDLKHLAQDLKQFEEPSAPPPMPSRTLSHGPFELPDPAPAPVAAPPVYTPPPVQANTHAPPAHPAHPQAQQQATHHSSHQAHPHGSHAAPVSAKGGVTWHVDARSLAAARELQERLNLSNEGEALRMLVTLGMERARDFFPS